MHQCMGVITWWAYAHDIAKEYRFISRNSTQ